MNSFHFNSAASLEPYLAMQITNYYFLKHSGHFTQNQLKGSNSMAQHGKPSSLKRDKDEGQKS